MNLNGCYWMAQACGRVMQPGSSIINISSVLGLTTAGLPQAAYSASKAGLIGLTRDLAQQWTGRKGIRVNALAPGLLRLGDDRPVPRGLPREPGRPASPSAARATRASSPPPRCSWPRDAAGYITGQTLRGRRRDDDHLTASPSITIIGAGFGGLGTAIELQRAGYTDITILEKADDVGGVWRENTYPNAACDVPSSLYSWSFAPNPEWPHRYSRAGRDPRLHRAHRPRSRACSTSCAPGSRSPRRRTTSRPLLAPDHRRRRDDRHRRAGHRRRPALPARDPGPARARHLRGPGLPLRASGTTTSTCRASGSPCSAPARARSSSSPASSPTPRQVTVFQRSAPYVVPKPDREYTRTHNRLFRRFPPTQAFGRKLTWVLSEQLNRSLGRAEPRHAGDGGSAGGPSSARRFATRSCGRS